MRYLVTVAAVAMLGAGAAQAARVNLTYTVEAELLSVKKFNSDNLPYDLTREVGDIETFGFAVRYDSEDPDGQNPANFVLGPSGDGQYDNLSLENGSGDFYWNNADSSFAYSLFSDGTGVLKATISAPGSSGLVYENTQYDVLSWSVEGLPMAPVPLPASGLLLLAGVGGFAWIKRRSAPA